MPPRSSLVCALLVGASLTFTPSPSFAGPGPGSATTPVETPPSPGDAPAPLDEDNADAATNMKPPPPSIDPKLLPKPEPEPAADPDAEPDIEFAVPPPELEPDAPTNVEPGYIAQWPDPGTAPNDGRSMLVLSSTTIILTAIGFSAGLVVGLRRQIPLGWLLPSTLVPTVGLLAFAGGGLYLGITRAQAHHRWEVGYRVIGTPQGGGLTIGASFALLGALGLIPAGVFALRSDQLEAGATMLAIGSLAAVATPIMFTLGGRYQADYQRTGGWRRRPIPPLPPGASGARLQFTPMVLPLPGGAGLGAAGRF